MEFIKGNHRTFCVCAYAFLVVASALRWLQYKWTNYLILIAMIAVAYFLIWLIMYILWKQELKNE